MKKNPLRNSIQYVLLNLPAAQRDPSGGLKCNTISLIRQVFASHYDVKTLCQEWRSKNSVMLPKNLPGD